MPIEKPYRVVLELYRPARATAVEYVQGDVDAYPLTLILRKDGRPYSLASAVRVVVTAKSPRGVVTQGFAEIVSAARGVCLYRVAGSEIAEAGEYALSVMVVGATEALTWQEMRYTVQPRLDDGSAIRAQPQYNVLTDLIRQVNGLSGGGLDLFDEVVDLLQASAWKDIT